MRIENRLLFFLAVHNMSRKKLADATGIHYNTITLYATGDVIPNVDKAIRIAKALKCSVHDIWDPDSFAPKDDPPMFRNIWRSLPTEENDPQNPLGGN